MRYATNSLLTDVAVIKYASTGAPVWTNRYSSLNTNSARPTALAVDGSGNAYVLMYLTAWQSSGFGTPVEQVIAKYDPLGNAVWTKHYPASGPDSGEGLHDAEIMALDGTGNLFVSGISGRPNWNTGSAIVKYAGDGTALWTNHHPLHFMAGLKSLSVDQAGAVILTGEKWTNYTLAYLALKCSKDGVSLWTNGLAGPGYAGGNVPQTVLDRAGSVFIVGGRSGTSDSSLYQILKLSGDGVPLWTNRTADFGSTNGVIYSSAVDSAGSLYLVGTAPAPGKDDYDYVTVKYSGDGRPIWTNHFDGAASLDDFPYRLTVGGAGDVYATGRSERLPGYWDLTTVKYADSLYYTPPEDFTGSDIITYTLTDNLGNSATGSVVVVVAPGAFQFNLSRAATQLTPGGLQLQLDGAPGTNGVVVEASPDLLHWQAIVTNTPINGSVLLLDSAATNLPRRFYRALQPQ